jgi:hypothetical protein
MAPAVLLVLSAVLASPSADRVRYQTAIEKARAWLDQLAIDPVELRLHGIKGKKKLVEALDAYHTLLKVTPKGKQAPIMKRVQSLAAVTFEERYHDMLSVDDQTFKQDATSYLRAAVLLERLGVDTKRYRQEIARIQKRLDAHLAARGPNQRRVFHTYYLHFGLKEPFSLENALEEGVIAHRKDPKSMRLNDVYDLTHEVYALYDFGEKLDADPFGEEDKKYLREALELLIDRYIAKSDPDAVAELLTSEHYLRFSSSPPHAKAIAFLLDSQNTDGSYGHYEAFRAKMGDWVKQGFYLHTTLVVIEALTDVFDRPMPKPRI